MHRSAQDGRIQQGLDHDQRPLAGGDGDAVRAFGVLVADTQRIPCREDGIRQLIVGAALTDALGPALQREDGNVEELRLRVGSLLAGADEGDAAALILQRSTHTPLLQPQTGAEVRKGVFQPSAAQRAQQQHLGAAFFGGKFRRIFGVGVVLDMGQDDDVILLLRAGRGVKVADDDVRFAAQRRTVAVARVAGDDEVIGPQQALQLRRDRAGRYDHTA